MLAEEVGTGLSSAVAQEKWPRSVGGEFVCLNDGSLC